MSTVISALRALRHITRGVNRAFGIQGHAECIRKLCAKCIHDDVLIDDFCGKSRFWCRLDEHIGSQIFWRGAYSTDQLAFLHGFLTSEMLFLDVGANQGEFTVFAAARLGEGHVLACEPVKELRERLQRNVSENGFCNVTTLPFGLGDRTERVPIYGPSQRFSDGTRNTGLLSLYTDATRPTVVETIDVEPLDQVSERLGLERLDVVKIDVEGAELSVLRGAEATIRRFRPWMLLELDESNCARGGHDVVQLIEKVESMGYSILSLTRGGTTVPFEMSLLQATHDVVCQPES